MAAAAIITLLPSVILAIFIQRYLVRGLTFGAVKRVMGEEKLW